MKIIDRSYMESINIDPDNSFIRKTLDPILSTWDIDPNFYENSTSNMIRKLSVEPDKITYRSNCFKIKLISPTTDEIIPAYSKPIKADGLITRYKRVGFGLKYLGLNKNDKFLTITEYNQRFGQLLSGDLHWNAELKGFSAYREIAALAVAKLLGLSHLAHGTIRNVNGELTYISKDLQYMYPTSVCACYHKDVSHLLSLVSHTDPLWHDKVAFEFLIGNIDFAWINTFIYNDKIVFGFDKEKSFLCSNVYLKSWKLIRKFIESNKHTDLSDNFIEKLRCVDTENYLELVDFIEQNIGYREARAFKNRYMRLYHHIHIMKNKSICNMSLSF